MKKPILLDYATLRNGENKKCFVYDYNCDMNMHIQDVTKPFIESDTSSYAMQTETRINREADDVDCCFAELMTKTEVQRERDDDEYAMQELLSKTAHDRERDDEDKFFHLELMSKTFVDRERDDEDDIALN